MHFFKTLVGSFYSPEIYRQARIPKQGMNLLYSFLLVMLTTAFIVIVGLYTLDRLLMRERNNQPPLLDSIVTDLARQVPVMTLKSGTLQVNAKQPYVIYLTIPGSPFQKFPFITIDTMGRSNARSMTTPVLITTHEINIKSRSDLRVYPLDQIGKNGGPLIINRALSTDSADRILNWLHKNAWKIYWILGVSAWIAFVIVAYILRIFMLMALGLVGLIASAMARPAIDFATAVQIAAIAYTPVAIAGALAFGLTAHSPSWEILFGLGALMTCVGVFVSREIQ